MENANITLNSMYEEKEKMLEAEQYIEAENIKKKIAEYKKSIILSQRKEIQMNQIKEKEEFEEMIMQEIEAFNKEWDHKENEKQFDLRNQLDALDVFHKNEIQKIYEEYEVNYKEKTSFHFLDMKKTQYELVKQERYSEANIIKKRAEVIYKQENEKWLNQWKNQMKIKIDNKLLKQKQIKDQVEKDIESKINLLRKEREKEYNIILTRLNLRKINLDYQQKSDIKRKQTNLSKTLRKKRDHSQVSTRNTFNPPLEKDRTT